MKLLKYYRAQDKYIFFCNVFIILCIISILIFYFLNLKSLPPKIPLFYSLSWGQPQLASIQQFIILPSMLTLIYLFNCILTLQLAPSQIALKRIIYFTTATIAFLILITAFKILTIFV